MSSSHHDSRSYSPHGFNWGHWSMPEVDKLLEEAQATIDPAMQTKLLGQAHSLSVDNAAWWFIVHDLNPRAMAANVTGFKPAQSWFVDLTEITMSPRA